MIKKIIISISILLFSFSSAYASLDLLEEAVIQQDFQKAKKIASKLLEKESDVRSLNEIRFYLALSYLRLGEYEQAKKIFRQLIEQPLEEQLRDRAYLGLFNSYYLNEEYRDALKIINKLYEISPDSPFSSLIYLKMARVNLKLTNWSRAQDYLEKIIDEYPQSMEVHTARQLLEERHYFAVQVGAFLDRALAEKQVKELRQRNEYAYIVETTDKQGRTFYRVRVGQMTLLDDARQLKSRLTKLGYPTQIYP